MRCKTDRVDAAVFAGRAEVLIGKCTSRGDVGKNKLGLGWWSQNWKPVGQRRDMVYKENENVRYFTGEEKGHISVLLEKQMRWPEQSSLTSKAEGPKALKKHYSHHICMLVVFLDQFNKLASHGKKICGFCQRIASEGARDGDDRHREINTDGKSLTGPLFLSSGSYNLKINNTV